MTTTRWWITGAVLAMAVIVALGWVLGFEPRLSEARAADDERAQVEAVNASYEGVLVNLEKLNEDLPALTRELDGLRAALPSNAQVSTLFGQLNVLAARSGVALTAITAGVPASFASGEPVAEAPAAPAEGEEAVAPVEEEPAPATLENFVSVPISVTATGEQAGVLEFVELVQFGTRLFLVEGLTVVNDEEGGTVTIEGMVYVLTDGSIGDAGEEPEGE